MMNDRDGWPIREGVYVSVAARTTREGYPMKRFAGIVTELRENEGVVFIRQSRKDYERAARPEQCRVLKRPKRRRPPC